MFVGYSLMPEIQVCFLYQGLLILGNETTRLYLALYSSNMQPYPLLILITTL